eukprot:181089-Rhodomonas_salina.1
MDVSSGCKHWGQYSWNTSIADLSNYSFNHCVHATLLEKHSDWHSPFKLRGAKFKTLHTLFCLTDSALETQHT